MFISIVLLYVFVCLSNQSLINVTGPGLQPEKIVMPARYFFVNFTFVDSKSYSPDLSKNFAVDIIGNSMKRSKCRIWVNSLDTRNGVFIVRYKIYETCYNLSISIYYKKKHIKGSPYKYEGPIQPDQCVCPKKEYKTWLDDYGCSGENYAQINEDLKKYNNLDMKAQVKKIIEKYHHPESTSFCHYVIKNNEIYRNCYGKHVGFNMFSDNILLSIARKTELPNAEFVINLGDWPLVCKAEKPLPVFSWCGSDDTIDIVLPTYDITESTIENMGRVSLDMLSVQSGGESPWTEREPRAIWRGRDSRLERLKLIDIARANPDLLNASLTNFFFFRDKESQYGPKQPHISFFKFFDYKYQINIDGTVAAYRLPYLLGGGGVVLKQDSPYYEHFYKQLRPWEHYIPVQRDLSDLVEQIRWAQNHDSKSEEIATNARDFAIKNLLPQHIICYHAILLSEWSKRISSEIDIDNGMEHVRQPQFECDCDSQEQIHEEL